MAKQHDDLHTNGVNGTDMHTCTPHCEQHREQWNDLAVTQHRHLTQLNLLDQLTRRIGSKLHVTFNDAITVGIEQRKQRKALYHTAANGTDCEVGQPKRHGLHREQRTATEQLKPHRFAMPSHFEYEVLLQLLQDTPYPFRNAYVALHYKQVTARRLVLSKLLAIALVRDLWTLLTHDHLVVAMNHSVKQLRQSFASGTDLTIVHARLLQRLVSKLCDIHLTNDQCDSMIKQATTLSRLVHDLDAKSRQVLHAELYNLEGDNTVLSLAVLQAHAQYAERQHRSWYSSNSDPFAHLRMSHNPVIELHNIPRQQCAGCGKPCALYCPTCVQLTVPDGIRMPNPVQLPVMVNVVHHPQENIKKSTSLHACLLAPDHCRIRQYDQPTHDYTADDTVLLYPTDDAQYIDTMTPEQCRHIRRVVCIESTWSKGNVVATHDTLRHLKRVKLRAYESSYWRYQELGNKFLSTLEAIYYTCVELWKRQHVDEVYDGHLDDLMYFYVYQHSMIRQRYAATAGQPGHKPPKTWRPPQLQNLQQANVQHTN